MGWPMGGLMGARAEPKPAVRRDRAETRTLDHDDRAEPRDIEHPVLLADSFCCLITPVRVLD